MVLLTCYFLAISRPQQLNFYSFRKIKYADTLRIDPQLEKETANYWRFRHEKFRRGQPQLLSEIKRMNGQKTTTNTLGSTVKLADTDKASKNEVQTLKKRIEEMNKNIDQLTAMVEKVTLKQEMQESPLYQQDVPLGAKRVKLEDCVRPDAMLSEMTLEETPEPLIPMPSPVVKRETTGDTLDDEMVDQLFDAFNSDQEAIVLDDTRDDTHFPEPTPVIPVSQSVSTQTEMENRPDPEMMNRLGEALATLPKDLQVLIVDRFIAAIMSTDKLVNSSLVADAIDEVEVAAKLQATPSAISTATKPADTQTPDLPLAAATFAALLRHYGSQLTDGGKTHKRVAQQQRKSIPVIPVNA